MTDLARLVVRHVTWPLYIERDAPGTLREWRALQESQHWPAGRVRELARARLRDMLIYAARHVPYYQARFREAGADPAHLDPEEALQALPPLEKRHIQDHRTELRSTAIPPSQLIENKTGGSTGEPLKFDLDRARSASRYAAMLRHNQWAGWEPGDRMAALWGAARDVGEQPSPRARLRNALADRCFLLNTAHVRPEDLESFVRALPRVAPKILLGYSRSLVLLARQVRQMGVVLGSVQAAISTAEVLEAEERAEIEAALRAPVFDRYGCREVSVIASECEHHTGMHLNAENLWVEIMTPGGPARPGQTGELLITDLRNLGMPLLRYRVGDLAAPLEGACPCGRGLPRIGPVTGRVTDFLLLPDGTRVSGAALTIVLVAELPHVRKVQLYQQRREEVVVRVVPADGFDASTEAELLARARRKLGPTVTVLVDRVAEIPPSPSGKHRFSISEAV